MQKEQQQLWPQQAPPPIPLFQRPTSQFRGVSWDAHARKWRVAVCAFNLLTLVPRCVTSFGRCAASAGQPGSISLTQRPAVADVT